MRDMPDRKLYLGPRLRVLRRELGLNQTQMLATLRSAIDHNRIDIFLQPRLTLPQRKVRFYEAVTRVRDDRQARCPRCTTPLRRATIAGRTAVWCPRCQRR